MKQQRGCYLGEDGASGRIRTSDRSVRSRVLYPAELRMHRETCFTADIDTAAKAVSSKRWCIREDDSLGSPFGPLLKQRYPPWRWRLSRRPWNNSVAAISEKMVHPGGFEPPTARFVAEYSIQLSYGCIGKLALLPILILLLKPYQVRDGASGRMTHSVRPSGRC